MTDGGAPGADALPAAVLWDMDGTLVDTEPYWARCTTALVERHGGTWTEADEGRLLGKSLQASARVLQDVAGLTIPPDQIVDELLADVLVLVEEHLPWLPGAQELLAALRGAGVRCGLVTNSYWRFAEPVLRALPAGTFDVVVTGDLVDQGKPHPEPYLRAMAELGVTAERTLAVEDSPTGTAAAEAAGCTVLVVPAYAEVEAGGRRVVRDSLVGLTPAALGALLG